MKKNLLYFLLLVTGSNLKSQNYVLNTCCPASIMQLNPNNIGDSSHRDINIDNAQVQNIWQVGKVNKTVFTSGYNGDAKAIVTDTIHPYPINNISSFQLEVVQCGASYCGGGGYVGTQIQVLHKYNTELGKDGGTIEVSADRGNTWANIINASPSIINYQSYGLYNASNTITSLNKPGFTGNSTNWFNFNFMLQCTNIKDTVLIRFTFASDSVNNGDGWMIGSIIIQSMGEGIQPFNNFNLINVSPNPVNNQLQIVSTTNNSLQGQLTMFDNFGQQVFYNKEFTGNNIDISFLKTGIYIVKYIEGNKYSTVKFIKQ